MAHKNSESEVENLSRIKDILFGEDLQSIEQKLDIVKRENSSAFEKLKKELETRFKKFELLLQQKTSEVVKALEKSIDDQNNVNDELKKEIVISLKRENKSIHIRRNIYFT